MSKKMEYNAPDSEPELVDGVFVALSSSSNTVLPLLEKLPPPFAAVFLPLDAGVEFGAFLRAAVTAALDESPRTRQHDSYGSVDRI